MVGHPRKRQGQQCQGVGGAGCPEGSNRGGRAMGKECSPHTPQSVSLAQVPLTRPGGRPETLGPEAAGRLNMGRALHGAAPIRSQLQGRFRCHSRNGANRTRQSAPKARGHLGATSPPSGSAVHTLVIWSHSNLLSRHWASHRQGRPGFLPTWCGGVVCRGEPDQPSPESCQLGEGDRPPCSHLKGDMEHGTQQGVDEQESEKAEFELQHHRVLELWGQEGREWLQGQGELKTLQGGPRWRAPRPWRPRAGRSAMGHVLLLWPPPQLHGWRNRLERERDWPRSSCCLVLSLTNTHSECCRSSQQGQMPPSDQRGGSHSTHFSPTPCHLCNGNWVAQELITFLMVCFTHLW